MNSQLPMDEFSLLSHFYSFFKYWWLAMITTLLGGLVGFLFSHLNAPIYEAKATMVVNVDFNKVTKFPVERQDEELALYNVQVALLDPQTIENLIQVASLQNISIDVATLFKNYTIERKLAFWELRYRDTDPIITQKIANLWIEEARKTFLSMQETGRIPDYVIIQGVTPAEIPQTPISYRPAWLIVAGGVIGLVCGILIVEALGKYLTARP
jgi:uncharacterized protein involved in exopolysaccharide biosynthesis